jgi:SMI1-KNR4 cell-wall
MVDEWEYPDIGICICDCPSAGHDLIMLDYSKCGRSGEPEVIHVGQEDDYRSTFLAKDFESFIRGLVSKDVYDTSDLDLEMDLAAIKSGRFSDIMLEFFKAEPEMNYENGLRNLFTEITNTKRHFSLHDDELSHLAYDVQFLLFSRCRVVTDLTAYLEAYPSMIAMANAPVSTKGYGPFFIEEWMQNRMDGGHISRLNDGSLKFTTQWTETVRQKLSHFLRASALQ